MYIHLLNVYHLLKARRQEQAMEGFQRTINKWLYKEMLVETPTNNQDIAPVSPRK